MNRIISTQTILFILFGLFCTVTIAKAQTNPIWTVPQSIPGLIDSGLNPKIVTDREGTIHIFNSQSVGDTVNIFYTRWTYQSGWSRLVDVITSPRGDARIYSAVLDDDGYINLLFWGGDEIRANVYYTKAPVLFADKANAWTKPILIGESALDPPAVALAMGSDNSLISIYSSNLQGNGLYVSQSRDNGNTWSQPESIFVTYNNQLWPTALQVYVDLVGNIFAVWAIGTESGNGQAIYFTKHDTENNQWTTPVLIAEAIDFEADTPSIIKYENNLMLVYHNNRPTTRWMRTSPDNGDSWSQPERLFEHVGSNGAASFVVDNNNNLRIIFGNRIDATATHGVWQSIWLGDQWSEPEAIVSGPQIQEGPNGEEGFDPSFVQATTCLGDLIFVLWRHDPQAGPQNIWYSYQHIDAPEISKTPKPYTEQQTPTINAPISSTQSFTVTSTSIITNVDPPTQSVSIDPNSQTSNPSNVILYGITPIMLIVFTIIIMQKKKQ